MRKISKATAKARADAAMSKYIRCKYALKFGDIISGSVKCITCGVIKLISEMHCAHFIPRGKEATRFVEENCHPACPSCNTFRKEFHMREYTLFMIDTYGREFVDELRDLSRQVCKRTTADYLQIEAYYKGLLEELAA